MGLAALAVAGNAGSASAHARSMSYSTWQLSEDGARVELRLKLIELTRQPPGHRWTRVMMFANFADRLATGETARNAEPDRLALRLWQYWDGLRGRRAVPLSPSTRMADVGEHGFTLDLVGEGVEPVFCFIGATLARQCGRDLTGRPVSEAPPRTPLAWVARSYKSVLDGSAPIGFESEIVEGPMGEISLSGVLLPFCDDGGRIDLIIGAATTKTLASDQIVDPPDNGTVGDDSPFSWLVTPRSDCAASPTPLDAHLSKCKALARKVQTVNSRSRLALYQALEGAYVFACLAAADPNLLPGLDYVA